MGKAQRNRQTRRRAHDLAISMGVPKGARSIARALRRHSRMPLPKRGEQA